MLNKTAVFADGSFPNPLFEQPALKDGRRHQSGLIFGKVLHLIGFRGSLTKGISVTSLLSQL